MNSWAVGWSQCNARYRGRIHDKWQEIVEKTSIIVQTLGATHAFSLFVADTGLFIENTVGDLTDEYEGDIFHPQITVEVNRLNTKWQKLSDEMMAANMKTLNGIDSQQAVADIVGHSDIWTKGLPRIDLVRT